MKSLWLGAAILFSLIANIQADAASILYSTTDIGTYYQFQTYPGGQDYGVFGSTNIAYAFDKSYVASIRDQSYSDNGTVQTLLTLQSGNYKVGYSTANGVNGYYAYPSFEGYTSGWFGGNPVSDLNIQGQAVGTSQNPFGPDGYKPNPINPETYAAFSAVGLQPHDSSANSAVVDNLNNYIATIPGVTLTSAVAIDDLGRILADGSNGQVYLLTPVALGGASTVPEPSTVLMFGMVGSLVGFQSLRQSWLRVKNR